MPNRAVIVVSGDPRGHFIEGYLAAGVTAKPGHLVSIKTDEDPVDGRPVYELWNGDADGGRQEYVVLRENDLIGKGVDDAYNPDGDDEQTRFFGYIPMPGDEFQLRFANVGTGTGSGEEDITIGQRLIPDDGTGNVIVTTGSPEDEPFVAMETIEDIEEDVLVLVRRR